MLANLALVLDIICYTIGFFKEDTYGRIGGLPLLLRKGGVLLKFVFRERSSAVVYAAPYPGSSGALEPADERLTEII